LTAINIISATKGGSGKTLLSFILHKALFGLGRGEETLLIDASNGNKDLSCFLSKFSLEREKIGGSKKYWVDQLPEGKLARPKDTDLSPSQILIDAVQLAKLTHSKEVIIDTSYDHFFPVRQLPQEHFGRDQFRFWYIWRPGTVLRGYDNPNGEEKWETIKTLHLVKHLRGQIPNMEIVNVLNPKKWTYGTGKYQRKVIRKINMKMREDPTRYTFKHNVRRFIYKPAVYMSRLLSALQGSQVEFYTTELMFLSSLLIHTHGTGGAKNILRDAPQPIPKLLDYNAVNKMEEVQPIKHGSVNFVTVPPPAGRIDDLSMFMFSSHMLRPKKIKESLGDENGLPYSLLERQAETFRWHIKALDSLM